MFSNKLRQTSVVGFAVVVLAIVLLGSSLRDAAVAANTPEAQVAGDPLVSFHFALELDGEGAGFFTECSGIGSENDLSLQARMTRKGIEVVGKNTGQLSWLEITCRRGLTSDLSLWTWREQVETGHVDDARKNGSLVMYDQELREVARWDFIQGWPSKLAFGSGGDGGFATEEITIIHEGLTRVN